MVAEAFSQVSHSRWTKDPLRWETSTIRKPAKAGYLCRKTSSSFNIALRWTKNKKKILFCFLNQFFAGWGISRIFLCVSKMLAMDCDLTPQERSSWSHQWMLWCLYLQRTVSPSQTQHLMLWKWWKASHNSLLALWAQCCWFSDFFLRGTSDCQLAFFKKKKNLQAKIFKLPNQWYHGRPL